MNKAIMKKLLHWYPVLLACMLCGRVAAQPVAVHNAWVRSTVPGQHASAAFMQLTAQVPMKLVAASSPLAGVVELHEMRLNGDVMQMRPLQDGLDLPANRMVELKPGGYHLMLMDLKSTLTKDAPVPVTLVFKDAKGVLTQTELTLRATSMPAPSAAH